MISLGILGRGTAFLEVNADLKGRRKTGIHLLSPMQGLLMPSTDPHRQGNVTGTRALNSNSLE